MLWLPSNEQLLYTLKMCILRSSFYLGTNTNYWLQVYKLYNYFLTPKEVRFPMSYLIGVSNINVLIQGNVILTLLKLQINKGFLSASVLGFITSIFKILVEVKVGSIADYEFRDCSP